MIVKQIRDEDFTSYKKPSMVIGFPTCSWKCEKECGEHCCQNSALAQSPNIRMECSTIIKRYNNNPITKAVICAGLEPFDSWNDLIYFIEEFRRDNLDDIVVYTGYNEKEVEDKIAKISKYKNIIVKFGRYVPNQPQHYDNILGVKLASNNQYAKVVSKNNESND